MPKRTAVAKTKPANYEAMIAEAAYYKAEQRSFTPGDQVADWLAAEAEVDAMLTAMSEPAAKQAEGEAGGKSKAKGKAKAKRKVRAKSKVKRAAGV